MDRPDEPPTMAPVWRVRMLGALTVSYAGRELPKLVWRKGMLALARIAYAPGSPVPRTHLIEWVWPAKSGPESDKPQADGGAWTSARGNAARCLSKELSVLRGRMREVARTRACPVVADHDTVRILGEDVTSDVAEFRHALGRARAASGDTGRVRHLIKAADLYTGELLPGLYDEWTLVERAKLRCEYLAALEALVAAAERAGHLDEAGHYAVLSVHEDPLDPDRIHRAMRVLAGGGNTPAALAQYDAFRRLFVAEYEDEPPRELQAYARRLAAALPSPGALQDAAPRRTGLRAAESPANGAVPACYTRFVGREREIARMMSLIGSDDASAPRLITLVGPGGIGKSRLAREAALRLHRDGGVHWAGMAEARTNAEMAQRIAHAVGAVADPGGDHLSAVKSHLRDARVTLFLDEMDSLRAVGADVLARLLGAAPRCVIVATSRSLIGLPGEHVIRLSPFPIPRPGDAWADIENQAGAALFLDRALQANPAFYPTDRNRPMIVEVLRRLGGVPLAIEIAAARLGVVPISKLVTMPAHDIRGPRSHAGSRHASMAATIQWSIGLLSSSQRRLLARVTVFPEGAGLAAVRRVCCEDAEAIPARADALEDLYRLSQCSLLHLDVTGTETRFRLPEPVAEEARKLLAPDELGWLRRRHAEWCRDIVDPDLLGAPPTEWFDSISLELPSVRAAFDWSVKRGIHDIAVWLGLGMVRYWPRHGLAEEGLEWIARLQASELASSVGAGSLGRAAAWLAGAAGDWDAAGDQLRAWLNSVPAGGMRPLRMLALVDLADVENARGRYADALRACSDGLAAWLQEHPIGFAVALMRMAWSTLGLGQWDRCETLLHEALDLMPCRPSDHEKADALALLGVLCRRRGDLDDAKAHFEAALELHARLRDAHSHADVMIGLALVACEAGRYADAEGLLAEVTEWARSHGRLDVEGRAFAALGEARWRQRSLGAADEALAASEQCGFRGWTPAMVSEHEALRAVVRATLMGARSDLAERAMSSAIARLEACPDAWHLARVRMLGGHLAALDDPGRACIEYRRALRAALAMGSRPVAVECIEGVAIIGSTYEDPVHGWSLLGAVQCLRAEMGLPLPPLRRPDVAVRLTAGGAHTDCTMTLEQAAETALEPFCSP